MFSYLLGIQFQFSFKVVEIIVSPSVIFEKFLLNSLEVKIK